MKRAPKVIWGTVAGALQIGVAMLLQIVLMPLILRAAGQEALGVYAIILQLIAYLALIDLGIYTALARAFSQAAHDATHFRVLFNLGFLFLTVLGAVYALLAAGFAFSFGSLFHLSGALAEQATVAILWLAAWGLLRFPLGLYFTALVSTEDLIVPPIILALANVVRMVLSVFAVQSGLSVLGLIVANVLAEALSYGFLLLRFVRLHPAWAVDPRRFSYAEFPPLFRFGLQAFWGNLAGRMILFTDNIVVGSLYGAAPASVYYNTQTPIAIAYGIIFRLADNASPGINALWAQREWEKLRDIFLRLQRLTLLLVAPVAIGGWFYLRDTLKIWVGVQQFAGQWMTLWLVVFALLITNSHVPYLFVYASGNIRRFTQLTTLEAVVNLSLSFVLGIALGLQGVALATTVAHLPTATYLQARVLRDLHIRLRESLRETFAPALLAVLPTTLAAGLLVNLSPPDSWAMLGMHALILGAIHGASVFTLGFTSEERRMALHYMGARWNPV